MPTPTLARILWAYLVSYDTSTIVFLVSARASDYYLLPTTTTYFYPCFVPRPETCTTCTLTVTSTMNMNDEDEAQSQSFAIGPKLSQEGGSVADCNSQAAATKATGVVV